MFERSAMLCNNWGPQIITQPVTTGRPFQARYEQICRKKTPEGQVLQETIVGAVFRDKDGRLRKELRLPDAPGEGITLALLADPLTESIYILDTQSRTFLRQGLPATLRDTNHASMFAVNKDFSVVDDEHLGVQDREGLSCHGHRGRLNDAVVEFWYSDELMEIVLEKRTAPDEDTTLRLFDIRRVEPDSELFNIPPGYTAMNEAQLDAASNRGGSNVPSENEEGESFLNHAAASGDLEGVRSQLAEGVDVNSKGYRNETPLMAAAECGHYAIVEELLRAGASVDLRSNTGSTALMFASLNGHTEIVRSLLAHGARTDMEEGRQTALMFATLNGNLAIVKLLLAAGADVNANESHHMTALMWAAERGHIEIVRALLAAGADVHAKNIDGYTALDIARLVNQTKTVSLLEEASSSD
ncbi:MAG TPA: ankyrin repeat domain-containing protein [Pyrinomonadaceae bacterium]|nr:ankyrin repeat domain-containing protein [Pyrinomonadaceae bacterium]